MEMQRLNAGMMERYEIVDRRPRRVNAVQFGMGEALLGAADRLIDDYNALAAPEDRVGIACVQAGEADWAARLAGQDGLYTLLIRGYDGDAPVKREQVVQAILRAVDPEAEPGALETLAREPDIALGLVDDTAEARALAAEYARLRREAGLPETALFDLGAPSTGGRRALADSLAFRSEPDEAARQCAEMNYLDDMLYLAEPCARLTLEGAPASLRARFPLDRAEGIRFGGLDEALRLKAEVFDAGVFLMAAPGWLNGCDTLRDCMANARLRRFVGEGFTRELLPALSDLDRDAAARSVIEYFERYENPLNRNRLLRAAGGMIGRFCDGPLRIMARTAAETFEPPRRLSFALAATIMLYAGARQNPDSGVWEVARGRQSEAIHDDPALLSRFAALSHDMDPATLAYAALADRELWGGRDLRDVEGLETRVALDIAAMQRKPGYLPDPDGTDTE